MATIAEIVGQLDVKLQVGALNGIVDAIFHPDHQVDGTGDKFKQVIYDGFHALVTSTSTNETIILDLEASVEELKAEASSTGNGWLEPQFDDFIKQARGTFPMATEETTTGEPTADPFGFPIVD